MGFISWWMSLPPILRAGLALLFIGISTALYFNGRFWPYGWGVGLVMLAFSIPEKKSKWGDW